MTVQTPDSELVTQVREIVRRILSETESKPVPSGTKRVALGCDHGGFPLKQQLRQFLLDEQFEVIDCGTFDDKPVDYPDYAYAVAQLVSTGAAWRGIVIDGAGIGSCMTANKVPQVRAAMCYDAATARNARAHNDANVLTLGGKLVSPTLAQEIVKIFLTTDCTEPRHLRRVEKIMRVEARYLRKTS